MWTIEPCSSPNTCTSTWRAPISARSSSSRPSPNALCASALAARSAGSSSSHRMNDPHAASAAARARLDHQGKADALRLDGEARERSDPRRDSRARSGTPASIMRSLAALLSPIARIAGGGGPMKTSPASRQHLREVGVLREKAVAGMDRLGASGLRGGDHVGGRQIGLRGRRGGPIRTAASARRTCSASASASL